jgi:two-component system copper resistance phosphate regulon response regulator CusR
MRILVVEDNAKLAGHLRRGLAESGYVVDVATDGIDGRHMAMEGSYDLLLLDVMLPGADGFTLLETLRQHKDTPVIMLTAADSVEDRVRGLRAGADDYLVKPFVFTELLARIQAVLRRGAAGAHHEPDRMVLGDLELDTIRRRAFRAGTRLDLTAQEYTLLSVLLRHRGEVMSRTVLTELVWDMNFDGDSNVVEVAIRRLRSKLDEPFPVKLLHTVRGMGYVLELDRGNDDGCVMTWRHPSIAARLTAGLGVVALVVFSTAGWLLQRALESELVDADRMKLAGKVSVVLHFIDEANRSGDRAALFHHLDDLRIGHDGLHVWLFDEAGDGDLRRVERQRNDGPAAAGARRPRGCDGDGPAVGIVVAGRPAARGHRVRPPR